MVPFPPTMQPSSRIRRPLLGLSAYQFFLKDPTHSSWVRSRLRYSVRKRQDSRTSSPRIGSRVAGSSNWCVAICASELASQRALPLKRWARSVQGEFYKCQNFRSLEALTHGITRRAQLIYRMTQGHCSDDAFVKGLPEGALTFPR
jgi:hypothetical protein